MQSKTNFTLANWFFWITQKKMWLLLVLGFASGLPLGLTGTTLQAWYTISGLDIVSIGFLALIGQPYVYKFIWAPVLDRYVLPFAGRRKGWMLLTQILLVLIILGMSSLNPQSSPMGLALLALLLAFMSATQDIAIDAYRTEILEVDERGLGAAMAVSGYRVAMMVSAGLTLILAHHFGFKATYLAMAICMALCMIATLLCKEPKQYGAPPPNFRAAFKDPLTEFFSRPQAIGFLALIIFYKLGDAFAGSLTTTFLIRGVGFTLQEVGAINKTVGLFSTLLGVFLGGILLPRIGLYRALFYFGILQAVSNLAFMVLAYVGPDSTFLILSVFLENLCGGMGTAAFVAFVMSLCDLRYTATQFALLSALSAIGRVFVGPSAGFLVKWLGWGDFFLVSMLIAVPGLLILWYYRRPIEEAYA